MKLEEAIKHLEKTLDDKSKEWNCNECRQEHEELLGFLKELKGYREDNEWISTKDRLPENDDYVFAVYEDDRSTKENPIYTISKLCYKTQAWKDPEGYIIFDVDKSWWDEDGFEIYDWQVLYWQPALKSLTPELSKELLRE